jgi:hypothetical protein
MRDEGKHSRWTVTRNEHGKSLKQIILRTYCALEWVMRTRMGAVTCVDPMALALTPPILRTTWGPFGFCNESEIMESTLSLSRIHLLGREAAKDR